MVFSVIGKADHTNSQIIMIVIIVSIMIMSFYGRRRERDLLERWYHALPGMIVITGRRRVGKTSRIRGFIKDEPSLYFFVDKNKSIEVLIHDLSRQVQAALRISSYVQLTTPEDLFDFILYIRKALLLYLTN